MSSKEQIFFPLVGRSAIYTKQNSLDNWGVPVSQKLLNFARGAITVVLVVEYFGKKKMFDSRHIPEKQKQNTNKNHIENSWPDVPNQHTWSTVHVQSSAESLFYLPAWTAALPLGELLSCIPSCLCPLQLALQQKLSRRGVPPGRQHLTSTRKEYTQAVEDDEVSLLWHTGVLSRG